MLARRSLSDPPEIAYDLAHAPVGIEIDELARIAGSRWAVEECAQAAKNECGLDECGDPTKQGRWKPGSAVVKREYLDRAQSRAENPWLRVQAKRREKQARLGGRCPGCLLHTRLNDRS
ncbi:hypothetical protein ACIQRN_30995 [[Kitasatospora] papulosa]|uniref:hypothetical protein n=1 Tax=[Kitasatospora] papulosa TaxID=1464011 RepID=UPI003800AACE